MSFPFRAVLVGAGGLALVLALAWLVRFAPVVALWPYPLYGLSHIFIASILAAIGLPVAWIGIANEPAALVGGALNIAFSAGAIGVHAALHDAPAMAAVSLMVALGSIGLGAFGVRHPFRDRRPTPMIVRLSFALFIVLLAPLGIALVAEATVFPWWIDGASSAVYGFVFIGAALYFAYGLVRPVWGNATGQLLGFLAYDLVLIGPYLDHWQRVLPHLRVNLAVYIAVLVYSGGLAATYLIIRRETAVWSRRKPSAS